MIFKTGNLTLCRDLILAPSLVVVAPSSSVSEGVTEQANFCLGGETSLSISESHVSEQLCISSYSICDVSVRISAS